MTKSQFTAQPMIKKAIEFFREAHDSIGQKRKYSGLEYWHHPEEVAEIVREFIPNDIEAYIAGLGHDWAEDVLPKNPFYSYQLIEQKFGAKVLEIILGLTDIYTSESFPLLNRRIRKVKEAERLGGLSASALAYEIHTIKLADLMANTRDIVSQDPGFARTYLAEKEFLLAHLTAGNRILHERAWQQLHEATTRLAAKTKI